MAEGFSRKKLRIGVGFVLSDVSVEDLIKKILLELYIIVLINFKNSVTLLQELNLLLIFLILNYLFCL